MIQHNSCGKTLKHMLNTDIKAFIKSSPGLKCNREQTLNHTLWTKTSRGYSH